MALDYFKECMINKKMATAIDCVAQDLEDNKEFVADFVSGMHRSAMLHGAPGMGKTHLITSALNKAGKVMGEDYLVARSHITPVSLYAMLYMMRKEGQYIIIDDCDDILTSESGLNLLKAATDPTHRTVGWDSSADITVPSLGFIIPKSFKFNGSVIIASNVSVATKGKAGQHVKAIKDRCVSWKINYDSVESQFAYIFHLVTKEDYLSSQSDTKLNDSQKADLLKFIYTNLGVCTGLSLRKPQHIARVIKNKPLNWKNHALRFLTAE